MLTLTNKDIREYWISDLLYHFVLFHHLSSRIAMIYLGQLDGCSEDNALLTYCYLEERIRLSYQPICCANLSDDGTVEYYTKHLPRRQTILDGELDYLAEVIDEDDEDMEPYRKVAHSVKKHYGYHKEFGNINRIDESDFYRLPLDRIIRVLGSLGVDVQKIYRYRLGLDDGIMRTLKETEDRFGISKEDIRQMEAWVIRKMRRRFRGVSHTTG